MICTCNNNIIITHSAHANSVKIIIILGDAAIKLTSTAQQNVLHPGEFATFFLHCKRLKISLDVK